MSYTPSNADLTGRPEANRESRAGRLRAGVTTLETAIVLGAFFTLLLTALALGLAAYRYNTLAAVARRVAREATVRGVNAPPERNAWGPGLYQGAASDSSEIAAVAASLLVTMNPADVSITVTWPDGGNRENDRVQVLVQYTQAPFIPFLPYGALALSSGSTMRILH